MQHQKNMEAVVAADPLKPKHQQEVTIIGQLNSEVNFSIHSSPVPYEMFESELSTSANGVHPLSDEVVQSDSTIILMVFIHYLMK